MNEFCFQFCLLTEHSTPRDLEHFGNPKNEKLLTVSLPEIMNILEIQKMKNCSKVRLTMNGQWFEGR